MNKNIYLLNRYTSGGFLININVKNFTMSEQKKNAQRLIRSLKTRKGVVVLNVYKGIDRFWINYFDITGFLNNKYFSVTIMKSDCSEECKIASQTDCIQEIEAILIKFNLK